MIMKNFIVLVLVVFVAGLSFAQEDFRPMPKNTITVDLGPTILGLGVGLTGRILENVMGDEEDLNFNTSGFGIGAQYERQLFSPLGAAGRFAFLRLGAGLLFKEGSNSLSLDATVTSFSAEGHLRFYPFPRRAFFLDGMVGYGNLAIGLDGYFDESGKRETLSDSVSRHYVKYGGKLGWRIDFGRPGGLIFEPSFGFYGASGLGDTFGKQVSNIVDGDFSELLADFDDIMKLLENYAFIGGPRFSLAFGLRF